MLLSTFWQLHKYFVDKMKTLQISSMGEGNNPREVNNRS